MRLGTWLAHHLFVHGSLLTHTGSQVSRPLTGHSLQHYPALFLRLLLLAGLAGCGPASSDNAPNLKQRVSTDGSVAGSSSASARVSPSPGDSVSQGDGQADKSDGTTNVKSDETDKSLVPGIPTAIAKDLDSPDARLRLRALDHWETKGAKAPLDPVFEALEDEDDAVRAKATAIIEQRWAADEEREKS